MPCYARACRRVRPCPSQTDCEATWHLCDLHRFASTKARCPVCGAVWTYHPREGGGDWFRDPPHNQDGAAPVTEVIERLHEGDRVWFVGQRMGYTVQAVSDNGRYAVCTKPFNARHTVLYCVVDFKERVRGVDNTIGNAYGYETKTQCKVACRLFTFGILKFSHRRQPIPLWIKRVERSGIRWRDDRAESH